MFCMGCTRSYGLFCKEAGCQNCGLSFCTKCLKKTINVQQSDVAKKKVCLKCFEILQKSNPFNKTLHVCPLSKTFLSDDVSTELTLQLKPITKGSISQHGETEATEIDTKIALKFDSLKNIDKVPTDTELELRLCKIKDMPLTKNNGIIFQQNTRTDEEEVDELITQLYEENFIDQSSSSAITSDIEKRLAALRDMDDIKSPRDIHTTRRLAALRDMDDIKSRRDFHEEFHNTKGDYEDETLATDKIVKQFLNEALLPVDTISHEERELISSLPSPKLAMEELPWCTICNEDAVFRCNDCSGHLYCRACFRECHEDEDYLEHKKIAYMNITEK